MKFVIIKEDIFVNGEMLRPGSRLVVMESVITDIEKAHQLLFQYYKSGGTQEAEKQLENFSRSRGILLDDIYESFVGEYGLTGDELSKYGDTFVDLLYRKDFVDEFGGDWHKSMAFMDEEDLVKTLVQQARKNQKPEQLPVATEGLIRIPMTILESFDYNKAKKILYKVAYEAGYAVRDTDVVKDISKIIRGGKKAVDLKSDEYEAVDADKDFANMSDDYENEYGSEFEDAETKDDLSPVDLRTSEIDVDSNADTATLGKYESFDTVDNPKLVNPKVQKLKDNIKKGLSRLSNRAINKVAVQLYEEAIGLVDKITTAREAEEFSERMMEFGIQTGQIESAVDHIMDMFGGLGRLLKSIEESKEIDIIADSIEGDILNEVARTFTDKKAFLPRGTSSKDDVSLKDDVEKAKAKKEKKREQARMRREKRKEEGKRRKEIEKQDMSDVGIDKEYDKLEGARIGSQKIGSGSLKNYFEKSFGVKLADVDDNSNHEEIADKIFRGLIYNKDNVDNLIKNRIKTQDLELGVDHKLSKISEDREEYLPKIVDTLKVLRNKLDDIGITVDSSSPNAILDAVTSWHYDRTDYAEEPKESEVEEDKEEASIDNTLVNLVLRHLRARKSKNEKLSSASLRLLRNNYSQNDVDKVLQYLKDEGKLLAGNVPDTENEEEYAETDEEKYAYEEKISKVKNGTKRILAKFYKDANSPIAKQLYRKTFEALDNLNDSESVINFNNKVNNLAIDLSKVGNSISEVSKELVSLADVYEMLGR